MKKIVYHIKLIDKLVDIHKKVRIFDEKEKELTIRADRKGERIMGLEQLLSDMREQNNDDKPIMCSKCNMEYIYLGLGHYKCDKCGEIVSDDYGKVRDYVEQSEVEVGIDKASKDTGVPVERIRELIEMGKISLGQKKR